MIPIDELRGAAPEKDCLLPKGGWGPGGSMSGLVKGRTFPLFRYIVYNSISCCHANTANTVNKILVTFAMIAHQCIAMVGCVGVGVLLASLWLPQL